MKMTIVVVLFLFCSGFSHFTFASNRLRFFSFRQNYSEWRLSKCNEPSETFITLFDEEDYTFVEKFLTKSRAWLGLRKVRNLTWSDGGSVTFNKSSVDLKDREQICEAIDNTTWRGFNCSEKKAFMCYKGNEYKLIKDKKNWCQALQHCRRLSSDLVSISNDTQNGDVIEQGNGTSFWIGLMHDDWEWTSKSCTSFRKWAGGGMEDFTVYDSEVSGKLLYKYRGDNTAAVICSKGDVRIKAIETELPWEEAFNYCKREHTGLLEIDHTEDMKAVQQWLNYTEAEGPFWIGMRQSRVFGFWVWSDRMVTYSNWKDDKQPELHMSHQCGVISKVDYKWSNENCLVPHSFLCEEEIVFMRN